VALNRHNLKGESWDTVEDQQAVIFTIHTRGSTGSYLYYPHSRQVNVRGSMILSSEAQVASSDARINFSFDILAFKLYVVLFDNLYRIYNVKKKNQKKNRLLLKLVKDVLNLRLKNPTMLNHLTNFSLIINGWVLLFRWERITLWTAKCGCSRPLLVPSVWFGSVAMWWRTWKVSNRLCILIGIRYPVKIILCTKMAGSLRGPVVYIISSLNELSSAVKKCLPNANITSIPLLQPGTVYNYRKT
jgi:hypothetical protein